MTMRRIAVTALALLALSATTAAAGIFSDPAAAGFEPRVPISALAQPLGWFDPSRLHMSTSFMVGSGFSGGTTSALNVTSFSYQFRAPLAISASLGNTFGPGGLSGSGNSSFFLEGLDLRYQPSANSTFRIQYRNLRSPLQYGYGGPGEYGERGLWGY